MYRKSRRAIKLERKRMQWATMRAAKERRRREDAQAAECVGVVTFEGPMFGGKHELRCLYLPSYSETHLMIEIDGRPHRPRTVRGVVGVLAKRLFAGSMRRTDSTPISNNRGNVATIMQAGSGESEIHRPAEQQRKRV
jgi:hypothetical protein